MTNHLYDALIAPQSENSACFMTLDEGETKSITFADFAKRSAQLANALVKHGVGPGDRVVVQAPKRSEMMMLYAATIQVGAVFLPLNTAYTLDELSYFITDASPKVIVCQTKIEAELAQLASNIDASVLTLNADGSGTLSAAMDTEPTTFETVPRGPDDLAALLYTSGTTGRSKGAMMTHDNLLSNTKALTSLWQITSDDVLVHALPIFHTHGLFVAMNTSLYAGVQVNFMAKFNVDDIVDALPNATMMMGVPTFYTRLLADDRLTKNLVSNMRLFVSGSAPLLAETHDAFSERTGHRILERYGMTETNMISSNPFNGDRLAGTVGYALDGVDIKICDDNGVPVKTGDVGMIEVRGPNVFKGYWNMPEKTAEELRDDGFFITGDLGQLNDHGYLMIVGRQKDLIITGGYNVYPKEIEDVLNDVKGVNETAVYGVPHADFGEQIIAAVIPETGASIDSSVIKAAVEDKLARFKHPRVYQIMDELPRNTMGKVQKNILRDTYSET